MQACRVSTGHTTSIILSAARPRRDRSWPSIVEHGRRRAQAPRARPRPDFYGRLSRPRRPPWPGRPEAPLGLSARGPRGLGCCSELVARPHRAATVRPRASDAYPDAPAPSVAALMHSLDQRMAWSTATSAWPWRRSSVCSTASATACGRGRQRRMRSSTSRCPWRFRRVPPSVHKLARSRLTPHGARRSRPTREVGRPVDTAESLATEDSRQRCLTVSIVSASSAVLSSR